MTCVNIKQDTQNRDLNHKILRSYDFI